MKINADNMQVSSLGAVSRLSESWVFFLDLANSKIDI